MKKVLIIGCGSIGSRHARNAKMLGLDVVLCDPDLARMQRVADELQTSDCFGDLADAITKSTPDAALIASPSRFHVEQGLLLASRDVPFLVEKPLATSREGLEELIRIVETKKLVAMMGQSYRFHEGFLKLKQMLDSKLIGQIFYVEYSGGQYLPDWHPGEDYRKGYAAQKAQGGGALFTSMSHYLDTIEWLFGEIKEYTGWKDRIGNLEIDTDDICAVLTKTSQNIVVFSKYDFLSRPMQHRMFIAGSEGNITADFIAHTISTTNAENKVRQEIYAFDANARYVKELQYFMNLVERRVEDQSLSLARGKHLVEFMCDSRLRDLTKI